MLLIDTYDTEAGARKVVALAPRLGCRHRDSRRSPRQRRLSRCRKSVRRILDAGGLADVRIFASGGLDEDSVADAP